MAINLEKRKAYHFLQASQQSSACRLSDPVAAVLQQHFQLPAPLGNPKAAARA